MKKFLALLLAFMMVFLVACKTDPPPAGNGGDDNGTNGGTVVNDGPRGHVHPIQDFGGRTLTIATWFPRPIVQLAWQEPNRETSGNYPIDRMIYDNARRVERDFNMKFEFVVVPWDAYMSTFNQSMLAGDAFADMVLLNGQFAMSSIQNNLISPWNRANLPNSDILGRQTYARPVIEMDGDVWAINTNSVDVAAWGLGINLDIINRDGLPNPVELYEAGEWNWENMLYIMRRATRDTDGSGLNNQFGIAGQPGDIVQNLISANDGMMVDTNMNYGFNHPNTIATLEFIQTMFSERLWHSEGGGNVMESGNWDRNFYAGLNEGQAVMFPVVAWALENSPPDFEFAFVPFPVGPNNTSGNTWMAPLPQGIGYPRLGSNWSQEEILVVMEEVFAWSGEHPELIYEAGVVDWLREILPTEADVQRLISTGNNAGTDVGIDIMVNDVGYSWLTGTLATHFWNRDMEVMQAVESYQGPYQEMLDIFFGR
jgi:multiple sugar transport system substrate-binding protein